MVFATVEVKRHTLIVTFLSLIASLIVAVPLALIFTPAMFLVLPTLGIPAGHLLFLGHQRRGLQVTRFRRLMNARKTSEGVFHINAAPFSTPMFVMHTPVVVDTAAPVERNALDWISDPDDAPFTPIITQRSTQQSQHPRRSLREVMA
ncbi:hypothetical protein [Leucobacter sp. cx-169]|uniref:hypothetical protein n=1 Tax=Leucobacter sp. cx-169 TaxID=2770549 RepID=UPI00165E6E44|nr:hypothetical protein [Leucobacter sp. cx-169]MBC9927384.1 hypothetical protein [Leucobacter sp. cx-169]